MVLVSTAFPCGLVVYACLYAFPYLFRNIMTQGMQQLTCEVIAQEVIAWALAAQFVRKILIKQCLIGRRNNRFLGEY